MRVGIVGAGQLGQMLGLAGKRLDLEFIFLDPSPNPPAAIAGQVLRFPFDSDAGLRELASHVDVLTYEFENVPVEAIERVGEAEDPWAGMARCRQSITNRAFQAVGIRL